MMTKLGKYFVLAQFVASTVLLGVVAFGIYPHRNNPNAPIDQGGGKMQSTIQRLDERIKDLGFARDRAEQRWRDAVTFLNAVEAQRPLRQQQFDYKLAVARTGVDGNGNRVAQPVTEVQFDPNGLLKFVGIPAIQHRGEDARSYSEIVNILHDFNKNEPMPGLIPAKQREIDGLMAQHGALTREILGDVGGARGLRKERELQEEAKKNAIVEQENLKPSLANRYADTMLLLKRQNALLNRKQELEKTNMAAGDRPEK